MKEGKRKRFSREFKLRAVELSKEPTRTVAEVARELNIRENDLHTWRAKVEAKGEEAFPGSGNKRKKEASEEMLRLREENLRLREERDILKKSAIFFAKEMKIGTDS